MNLKRGGGLVTIHDGMCSNDASWFATIVGAAKQHGEINQNLLLRGVAWAGRRPVDQLTRSTH